MWNEIATIISSYGSGVYKLEAKQEENVWHYRIVKYYMLSKTLLLEWSSDKITQDNHEVD